jgi:hypothetical protein
LKQSHLRCLGWAPGFVSLGAFASNAFAINGRFKHQVERLSDKPELELRDRQAASVSFHGNQAGFWSAAKKLP